MNKESLIKVGVFLLLLFFSQNIFAQNFILSDDGLIDNRAKEKIIQIGTEAKSKLGVNIYVYVKSTLGLPKDIKTSDKIAYIKNYEKQIVSSLKEPYVLLTLAVEDTHANLYYSKNIKNDIDKDEVLDGYVIPLLASKDKNTLFAKVSAATLNGYAAIADIIAEKKDIKLETSIGNSGKVSSTIWRVFMYTLIVLGLLVYIYAVMRKRK